MRRRGESLPRERRITRKDDFERLKKEGSWLRGKHFDFIHMKTERDLTRLGVIVPLHSHNVVERNRLKRRVKDIMRRHVLHESEDENKKETGMDIVIRARKPSYEIGYEEVKEELIALSRRMMEEE